MAPGNATAAPWLEPLGWPHLWLLLLLGLGIAVGVAVLVGRPDRSARGPFGSAPRAYVFGDTNELCLDGVSLNYRCWARVEPVEGQQWQHASHVPARALEQAFRDVLRATPLRVLLADVPAFAKRVIEAAAPQLAALKVQATALTIQALGLWQPPPPPTRTSSGGASLSPLVAGAAGFTLGMMLDD